jgi:hypothetical protein
MKIDMNSKKILDVVVIGGGPAGMMAAGRAAELGHSVLLLEKNATLGKKLLITGGGRCNVTNNKQDVRSMLPNYKRSDKFLFSAFSQFGVKETLEFFNSRGMQTKEENEGRIFPVSDKAQSVWDVLEKYMKDGKVRTQTKAEVNGLLFDKKAKNIRILFKNGEEISAKSCILATGGTSHPETGSTGEGFKWLKKLGHKIEGNSVALVPVSLKDYWTRELSGVTLSDIKLTVFQNGEKRGVERGKILFTHLGISGPTVLNMSKDIGEYVQYGEVRIDLDLFPKLDHKELKKRLQALLTEESNKKIKNTIGKIIPEALGVALLQILKIDGETFNHSVRSEDRKNLIMLMKAVPLNVKGLLGPDKAVVSSGGVTLEEVDFKTMQSRIVPNLYLIGDVLNIDRPSGGYSLQICWTTGYVAGNSCKEVLK